MATNFYSPELENLKKSLLAQDWFKSPYEDLFKQQISTLQNPQAQINTARANILGQTNAGLQEAQRLAGSRGFLAGQSGIADRAMQDVIRQGQSTLGQAIGNINAQNLGLINQLLPEMAQQASFGMRNATEALQQAGGLEQFPQQFDFNKLMAFLNLLQNYYSGEQQAQLARYSPYWGALTSIYGG